MRETGKKGAVAYKNRQTGDSIQRVETPSGNAQQEGPSSCISIGSHRQHSRGTRICARIEKTLANTATVRSPGSELHENEVRRIECLGSVRVWNRIESISIGLDEFANDGHITLGMEGRADDGAG